MYMYSEVSILTLHLGGTVISLEFYDVVCEFQISDTKSVLNLIPILNHGVSRLVKCVASIMLYKMYF